MSKGAFKSISNKQTVYVSKNTYFYLSESAQRDLHQLSLDLPAPKSELKSMKAGKEKAIAQASVESHSTLADKNKLAPTRTRDTGSFNIH